MPKEDLIKYIEEAKSRGVSDNGIRTTLLYAHWTKEEIAEAFKGYDESRTPFDQNNISGTMSNAGTPRIRSVNFSSKGQTTAVVLEQKSRSALIVLLLIIFLIAAAAFWYIADTNGVFVKVRAVPYQQAPTGLDPNSPAPSGL